ncbi:MAG: hypothetical protein ABSD30_04880 [Candidatus Binatus sp.]
MAAYTLMHVLISLVGIVAGFIVVFGLFGSKRLNGWTALFLATTVATSVTGFGFPVAHLMPSHIIGIISLMVLTIAILARYTFRLAGAWRWVYVVGAVLAFYLNFFVLIVQLFRKVPALEALAPTQTEPPFVVAQVAALVMFIVFGVAGVIRFHPEAKAGS